MNSFIASFNELLAAQNAEIGTDQTHTGGIGNSTPATTPGTVVAKTELFDGNGNSLGFLPIYDTIA